MATTPNYSLSIYDSSDTDVRFLDFRVAIAGTQTTSNFYVIDGTLKEHSDAINTLKNSPQAYIVKANFASGVYNASVSGFPGYKTNQLIVLSLNQTNTGAVSININNSSAKNVMLYNANGILRNFIAGEFVSNSPALCYYDGTQFVAVGIPRGSATYVDGERGDVLQISSDGAIESSGKQIGNPNGIATLDSGGKVEQIAKVSDSAASGEAVYNGNSIEIPYVSENRIACITAYGENAQGGTTEAPVALTGVDSVHVCGRNLLPLPYSQVSETKNGLNIAVNADGTITVSGTATAETYLNLNPIPASLYRLMGVTETTPAYDYPVTKNGFTFFDLTIQPDVEFALVYIVITKDSVVNRTYRPYIIKSAEPLPYETYHGSVTALPIPRPLHEVGDVRDVCRTRVKSIYDKRIVLDGTENWIPSSDGGNGYYLDFNDANVGDMAPGNNIASSYLKAYKDADLLYLGKAVGICAIGRLIRLYLPGNENPSTYFESFPLTVYYQSFAYNRTNGLDVCQTEYQTDYIEGYADESITTAWISSTGALSPGADVAYVLSSPETYAADPLDIDNAAGPLTVLTGGELEVKLNGFISASSPSFKNKLDKNGDGSNVTVTLPTSSDTGEITSGDTLSIISSKIKSNLSNIESDISDIIDGTTTVGKATSATSADSATNATNATKATQDASGNVITSSYASTLTTASNNTVLKSKSGATLSSIVIPYATSAGSARANNISMSLSGTNLSISYS